jgi:uncharacterized protein YbjQ (UPF0145 family)
MSEPWSGSGLPPIALERVAEGRRSGTWSSALSTAEFAGVRAAGFAPVGQVLGSAVYHIGYAARYQCAGAWTSGWGGRSTTEVSSGGWSAFAPLVRALYDARRTAIGRMVAETSALGGDGVVGVRLHVGQFPAGGLEFRALGTAVRAQGDRHVKKPFTSHLSGQEFAKLVLAGWIPVGLALGISIGSRHDDWQTRSQTRWRAGNNEVEGYTELVNLARHDARRQLEGDVRRFGGDGVVVSEMDLDVRHRECPAQEHARDHIVEANFVGTAIARFDRTRGAHTRTSSLAIMSLDPERRRAARARDISVRLTPGY